MNLLAELARRYPGHQWTFKHVAGADFNPRVIIVMDEMDVPGRWSVMLEEAVRAQHGEAGVQGVMETILDAVNEFVLYQRMLEERERYSKTLGAGL